ncbi:hypothetical protein BD309DRAFT_911636 [Dichomitus squalens]|nr:hypothetical protein BD309DRAFT_911636 [Dichomitus squalens]
MGGASDPNAAVISEVAELTTTFYVGVASFTVLVWDHLVTLSDEIEYVWKRKKSALIYLFFLNRYMTPLGFCVNLFAYFSSYFTPERCQHFVRYEGTMTLMGINVTALMMLLRIYAIYEGRKLVVALVAAVFLCELGVNAWLLSHGIAVRHSHNIHACTMIFDSTKVPGGVASASAWLPLLYDTVILILTLLKTYKHIRNASAGRIMRVVAKEGLVYYGVIFTITFILTFMILLAPDGLKNITAQTEYLLTVAMMSRITLHLKKQTHGGHDSDGLFVSTSEHAPGRVRFTRAPEVSITVQRLTHDDRGGVVDMPKTATPVAFGKGPARRDEWHELGPVHLDINASHGSAESGIDVDKATTM